MRISDQRGFALFGLLLVAALIATLASIWGLEAHQQVRRDREQMLLDTGRELRQAIASYHKRAVPFSINAYPSSIDELLHDTRGSYVMHHLRSIPVDPVTKQQEWGVIRVGGKIVCFHSKSQQRPLREVASEEKSFPPSPTSYAEWRFCHPNMVLNLEKSPLIMQDPGQQETS